ncbi:hypothetical protein FHS95_002112 [Sphingomonas naasensis]|uniref:Uncharacterized protein n=1 Tax=Sphingomonas naasensis TaxID=1344951 RepID=A0A4S1WML8_9SPHN|nr:hypothetical protein [Sphingomonas naasensis]NIJ20420.1 hypothetical protein [Sphingomonas naasensis]TGX44524.1 hypothetical protein E5A74_07030 [Sphingomonas naasensis]
MRKASGLPADTLDHPIWSALSRYSIGPQDAALPFAARLARENGWSRAEAERVIEEYKRFCFLAVTAGHPVTPSDQVDQAWHLHLTYSRDYWERFCPEVLGRALHHGPTAGGSDEQHRYFTQYAETLRSYERVFGPPPADLWPDAARRLNEDHKARRVHPRDAIIVSRKLVPIALLLAVLSVLALGVLLLRS